MKPVIPMEIEGLEKFRAKYPDPRKVAFVMMRIGNTKLHDDILSGIKAALAPMGIEAVRADENWFNLKYLLDNILTHIYGCGFGVAVFDRIEDVGFNANVMFEIGYMMALGKPICLLKDQNLTKLPTDLVGKPYVKFDSQDPVESISRELPTWLKGAGVLDPVELSELRELVELISKVPKTEVRHLRDARDVRDIFELGKEYYGNAAMSYEVLLRRWERYRKGIHGLFIESDLIGGIGLWPVSRERFKLLISGQLKKRETNDFIVGEDIGDGQGFWYVGNVILKRELWRSNLQLRLLEAATRAWIDSGDVAPKVTLCGLGYSNNAVTLLRHFRFIHQEKYFNEFPVYTRSATIEELRRDYEELILKRMWHA